MATNDARPEETAESDAPDGITHEALWAVAPRLPGDYGPWGEVERWADESKPYPDCSCGCAFAAWLESPHGTDWCVCTNAASHRAGLLTFEHQGCQAFVQKPEEIEAGLSDEQAR